jgi:uncharacterized protein YjbI with pentapeptide repeats
MARGMTGRIGAAAIVAALVATGSVAASSVAAAKSSPPIHPTIQSLTVDPPSMFSPGGSASISADVANATSCTFSSTGTVTGLPVTVPCSSGSVQESFSVGANASNKKEVTYKIKLIAVGQGKAKSTVSLSVDPTYCSNIAPSADLSKCDLAGMDLEQADLTASSLTEANLSGADLSAANLGQANMTFIDLAGSDLANANMFDSILSDATLSNATATNVDLDEARMTDAKILNANLTGSELEYVDLDGANLDGTNLTNADLTGALLASTQITGVIWSNTICPDGSNSDREGGTCANNLG